MSEPLVSVCMITYNHRPYIVAAVEGVLRQETEYPFELVIGEDCSTDGTREIVLDYQKRYPDVVRVIHSERNVGARANHARTIAACRGQYVAFCEGDDFWHRPDKLQLQVSCLEKHPEYGLVCSDYDCRNVTTGHIVAGYNRRRGRTVPARPTMTDFALGRGGIWGAILTCTVVVRVDLLRRIRQDDPFLHGGNAFSMGDVQCWAELSHLSEVGYIDSSLATHNLLPESAARSRDERKSLRFSISGREMLMYLCEKYALPAEVRQAVTREWCQYSFQLAFLERDLTRAGQVFDRGYRLSRAERIKYRAMRHALVHGLLRRVLSLRWRVMSLIKKPEV